MSIHIYQTTLNPLWTPQTIHNYCPFHIPPTLNHKFLNIPQRNNTPCPSHRHSIRPSKPSSPPQQSAKIFIYQFFFRFLNLAKIHTTFDNQFPHITTFDTTPQAPNTVCKDFHWLHTSIISLTSAALSPLSRSNASNSITIRSSTTIDVNHNFFIISHGSVASFLLSFVEQSRLSFLPLFFNSLASASLPALDSKFVTNALHFFFSVAWRLYFDAIPSFFLHGFFFNVLLFSSWQSVDPWVKTTSFTCWLLLIPLVKLPKKLFG